MWEHRGVAPGNALHDASPDPLAPWASWPSLDARVHTLPHARAPPRAPRRGGMRRSSCSTAVNAGNPFYVACVRWRAARTAAGSNRGASSVHAGENRADDGEPGPLHARTHGHNTFPRSFES